MLTKNAAEERRKPCLVVDLTNPPEITEVRDWLREQEIRVLNVAGPRASQSPDAYRLATRVLVKVFASPTVPQKRRRLRPKA